MITARHFVITVIVKIYIYFGFRNVIHTNDDDNNNTRLKVFVILYFISYSISFRRIMYVFKFIIFFVP